MDVPAALVNDLRQAQILEEQREENSQIADTLIPLYQNILARVDQDVYPYLYADLQVNLGIVYYEYQAEDRTTYLEAAIYCYQQALSIWTLESTPFEYGRTQNNLGAAYSELEAGDRESNLHQAIASYQQALRAWTIGTAPQEYARAQFNLGMVYGELLKGDETNHLQCAISCYEKALIIWSFETDPDAYATIQQALGVAYSSLPTGNRAENLHYAIECYHRALSYRTLENTPFESVMTRMCLGNAYRDLPTGDRATNLQYAMQCYQACLLFWEAYQQSIFFLASKDMPLHYATLQTNLGILYTELQTGDRTSNLRQAIACHEQALRFRTLETTPDAYARTTHNLGSVYLTLPTGDRVHNLTKAIEYFQKALCAWSAENMPFYYAFVQDSLGMAYAEFPIGDHQHYLRQAIDCYQQAIGIRTSEVAPLDYASTQNNLGLAYSELLGGDHEAHIRQAVHCYQEALRFWTSEVAPFECRMVLSNLGNLYFAEQVWDKALENYRSAIYLGEWLYLSGLFPEGKAIESAKNAVFYHHAAFSAARCGQAAEAFLLLEQGKTQGLAEALRTREPRPSNLPDDLWDEFEKAQKGVIREQQRGASLHNTTNNLLQEYLSHKEAMDAARSKLDAATMHIHRYAPDFLQSIHPSTFTTLLTDKHMAIIAFCITEQGSIGLVSTSIDPTIHIVEAPDFTRTDLRCLFADVDIHGQVLSGWLLDYERHYVEDTSETLAIWQQTIINTLEQLGKFLLTPILSALPSDIQKLLFLPSAELFLLPLHTAPFASDRGKRVCDRYIVNYAPSAKVFFSTQRNIPQHVQSHLYAIINPTSDPKLFFSAIEGKAIAKLFAKSLIDEGKNGTKQQLVAEVLGYAYFHFSGHSHYDWDIPAQSGLELYGGRLTLTDLENNNIDFSFTRLVTLSSCEMGIIDIIKNNPEEFVGLPAMLLLAGAPCIVSSLWVASDISTALLMERMYRNHMQQNMDIPAALQEAQMWVHTLPVESVIQYIQLWYDQSKKDNEDLYKLLRHYRYQARQNPIYCPFEHPFFWAGFIVNGR